MNKFILKQLFFILLLGVTINSCKKYEQGLNSRAKQKVFLSKKFYPNGQLKEAGALVDSLKNGYWITYSKEGNVEIECTYLNDTLNGPFILYYFNGNIKVKGNMKSGDWQGKRIFYYLNGNIKNQGEYENGKLNGIWEYFDENGNLDKRIVYKNGEKPKVLIDNKLMPDFP